MIKTATAKYAFKMTFTSSNMYNIPVVVVGPCTGAQLIGSAFCDQFQQCAHGKPYAMSCPAGLGWNPTYHVCDWKASAVAGGNGACGDVSGNTPCSTNDKRGTCGGTTYEVCTSGGLWQQMPCAPGTVWDSSLDACNHSYNLGC